MSAETIAASVQNLRQTVQDHCVRPLEALQTRLDEDEARLDELADQYDQALAGLLERFESGQQAVRDAFAEATSAIEAGRAAFEQRIDETTAAISELESAINQAASQIDQATVEIGSRFDESGAEVTARLQELDTGLVEWTGAAQRRLEEAGTLSQTLLTALDEFATARDQGFDDVTRTAGEFSEAISSSAQTLASEWDSYTEQLGQSAQQIFLEQISDLMGGQLDKLHGAFADFHGLGDNLSRVFGEDAEGVIGKLQEIAALIEQIKPLLDLVDEIM